MGEHLCELLDCQHSWCLVDLPFDVGSGPICSSLSETTQRGAWVSERARETAGLRGRRSEGRRYVAVTVGAGDRP